MYTPFPENLPLSTQITLGSSFSTCPALPVMQSPSTRVAHPSELILLTHLMKRETALTRENERLSHGVRKWWQHPGARAFPATCTLSHCTKAPRRWSSHLNDILPVSSAEHPVFSSKEKLFVWQNSSHSDYGIGPYVIKRRDP